ncbi:hypothetical protein L1N85_22915 [Paenibacillus alkaliterrae]|uniref:hypothetical protein n=1 Tax=Paenibacillus alkaliterrae TaxID=320909 RepID=UPI001F2FFFBE|nr:hypothetical protein [Paenibacillus alkaliterrae]MCF2941222.1 hypothetical protein [Paenibacillus alkaliterrae]
MHTRQGLSMPYMGEQFMDAVEVAADEALAQGLEAWCYDENGWPSGTANGVVPALGVSYQQKSLEGIPVSRENAELSMKELREHPDFLFLPVPPRQEWYEWASIKEQIGSEDAS